jgi:hypothetical protein
LRAIENGVMPIKGIDRNGHSVVCNALRLANSRDDMLLGVYVWSAIC